MQVTNHDILFSHGDEAGDDAWAFLSPPSASTLDSDSVQIDDAVVSLLCMSFLFSHVPITTSVFLMVSADLGMSAISLRADIRTVSRKSGLVSSSGTQVFSELYDLKQPVIILYFFAMMKISE